MDDVNALPQGEVTVIPASGGEASIREAARSVADFRYKREAEAARQEEKPAESAEAETPATAEQESAPEADTSPEAVTSETEANDQAAELPPIEPPKSWTKEAKERWNSYTRDAQEEIARVEQGREREFLRSQQEAAEQRKAAQAQQSEAEKVRQQYEAQLPALMQALQEAHVGAFPDIRTVDDLAKLQREDPFRFQEWQVQQMKLQAVQTELQKADERKSQERLTKRQSYEAEQNKRLAELLPEAADPKKFSEIQNSVVSNLNDRGIPTKQLQEWMQDDTGHAILSNASMQKLMVDGLKYQEIQKAKSNIVAKPLPPAQRSGAGNTNVGNKAQIQELNKQLTNATGIRAIRLAAEITRLGRKAG